MGKFVIKEGYVEINGVDLSDHIKKVVVHMGAVDVDATGLNYGGGTEHKQGLKDEKFECTVMSDFDVGQVDDTLFPLYDAGTEFEVRVAAFPLPITAANPAFAGTCILLDYEPISGSVGELSTCDVTIPVNGRIAREVT
jgi:hypothetical protein